MNEEETQWTCECGSKNTSKFCPECGAARPKEEVVSAKEKAEHEEHSEARKLAEQVAQSAAKSAASQAARTITREVIEDIEKALKK